MKTKVSAAIAVWEANIKLAKDIENVGSQNVVGWHEAHGKITGEPIVASQDLA